MAIHSEDVSEALLKLRDELGLTQVQVANEIGVTPTSIHRYETQASTPDLATLVALWDFALRNGSLATTDFSNILADNIEPLRPLLEIVPIAQEKLIESATLRLQPADRILVMALIKMLEGSCDGRDMELITAVLKPWIKAADAEFAQLERELQLNTLATQAKKDDEKPLRTGTAPKVKRTGSMKRH